MSTLSNVNTRRGEFNPPTLDLSPMLSPEKELFDGASVEYVQEPNKHWYVLRVTYNRIVKACELIKKDNVQIYYPIHYVQKIVKGKKKRIIEPFLPNLIFVYSTKDYINSFIKNNYQNTYINFYYNHFEEIDGKNPPLIVDYHAMMNFIKITSINNEHIRLVNLEQCHFKNGDLVRVIEGDFKGVVGRVARVSGQQRVVVNIEGVCTMATAYIPNAFLEKVSDK